jgi:hypothetical protein
VAWAVDERDPVEVVGTVARLGLCKCGPDGRRHVVGDNRAELHVHIPGRIRLIVPTADEVSRLAGHLRYVVACNDLERFACTRE